MTLSPVRVHAAIALVALSVLAGCSSLVASDGAERSHGRSAAGSPADPHFSPETLLGHIYYLASDEIGGRLPGTPGMRRAGRYIADQFAAAGVEPAGEDGTYFQTVKVGLGAKLSDEGEFVVAGAEVGAPVQETDYVPFSWSSGEAFDGQVVFVGYGLVNPEKEYDDYAGVDVAGKVLLMLRREPPLWQGGGGYTAQATFENKAAQAAKRGAVAVLIANQKPGQDGSDRLVRFRSWAGAADYGLPGFHVTRQLADKLLAAGGLDSLDVLQDKLDAPSPTQCSAPMGGLKIKGQAGIRRNEVNSPNVVGLVRGTGPRRDEYVVIGAHYDHVGKVGRRSFFGLGGAEEPEVHNGADDNASGTAGVIELGKALARTPNLNRSVLLIAFTAEEKGFVGSRHFVKHPTVPLEQIVAMVNLDMIGRMAEGSNSVWVYGTGTADGLEALVRRCAGSVGMEIQTLKAGSEHSDDRAFHEQEIPAIHFFTGVHVDLHQPTDDAEKINEQDAVRVLRVVHDVACELIDTEVRPAYCYVPGYAELGRSTPRVVMGFWPGSPEGSGAPGVLVGRTVPDGPAAQAGLQAGDRIVEISGRGISGPADYAEALGGKRPGDTVEVVVERGGQRITLTVTLTAG